MITDGSVVIHGNPAIGQAIADGIAQGKADCAVARKTKTILVTPTKCSPNTADTLRRETASNAASIARMDDVRRRYPLDPGNRIEPLWGMLVAIWWAIGDVARGRRRL